MNNIAVTMTVDLDNKVDILYGHITEIKEHMTDVTSLINIILYEEDFDKLIEWANTEEYQEILKDLWIDKERSLVINR